jgi:diguanylate cyclase (GGDEF)-like protein/PAS domain S-box-containing protein
MTGRVSSSVRARAPKQGKRDLAEDSADLLAGVAGRLEGERGSLAETATHSGTWQWDARSDSLLLSPGLLIALPGLQLGDDRGGLLTTPQGDPFPAAIAEGLPGSLARALGLAASEDRLSLAVVLSACWTHRAGFELTHLAGDSSEQPDPDRSDPANQGAAQAERTTVRHVGSVVTDTDGRPMGVVGVVTVQPVDDAYDPLGDMESARRYRQLMRVLPLGVVIHQDGVIVDANPALVDLVRVSGPEHLVGTVLMDWVVPEGRRRLMNRIIAMSRHGAVAPAEEETLLLSDGSRLPVEIVSIRTTWRGQPAGQAVITDISERKAILQQLTHDATHDALTGLGNRRLIVDELTKRMDSGVPFSVLFVDLDKFKEVNDSYGHTVGDDLLRQAVVGLRSVAAAHPGTFTGRLSGDEFILLVPADRDATAVAEAVCSTLSSPFTINSWNLVVTCSVGIAHADPAAHRDLEPLDLIRDADVAMYRAKEQGRNRWIVFDESMRQVLDRRMALNEHLRRAVDDPDAHGMRLVYQPIVRTADDRVHGVEALIRWDEPALDKVFPDEFIPSAEENGMIIPLGHWILMTACRQLAQWRRDHAQLADLRLAVNLSPRQLAEPGLVELVRSTLDLAMLPPAALCLEITETALADDVETATRTVTALHALGIALSIDDFGTGYSSLSYLRSLPVDELKVDRSFVSGLGTQVRDETICASVISMAHLLGLAVVAEGIETQEQQDQLSALGCDYIQGYHKSRPKPPREILPYLLGVPGPGTPNLDHSRVG